MCALKWVLSYMRGASRRNWTTERMFLKTKKIVSSFDSILLTLVHGNGNVGGDGQGFLAIPSHNSKVPHPTWRTTNRLCGKIYSITSSNGSFSRRSKVRRVTANFATEQWGWFWITYFICYFNIFYLLMQSLWLYTTLSGRHPHKVVIVWDKNDRKHHSKVCEDYSSSLVLRWCFSF